MPTYVRTDSCDGCSGREAPACVRICPHDLMRLDSDGTETGHANQAYNREPEQCWECYACVKICPQQAVECRHYADIVPLGASVQPVRGANSITWTVRFRDGTLKVFTFPTRTNLEGSADPYGGEPEARLTDIADHGTLFTRGAHGYDATQFVHG